MGRTAMAAGGGAVLGGGQGYLIGYLTPKVGEKVAGKIASDLTSRGFSEDDISKLSLSEIDRMVKEYVPVNPFSSDRKAVLDDVEDNRLSRLAEEDEIQYREDQAQAVEAQQEMVKPRDWTEQKQRLKQQITAAHRTGQTGDDVINLDNQYRAAGKMESLQGQSESSGKRTVEPR